MKQRTRALRSRPVYPKIGRSAFMAKLMPHLSPQELEEVESAYVFAKYGHRNQWRDGGRVRYFEHPKTVALILIDELRFPVKRAIVLALLHDTQEDSYILSWQRLERNFGKRAVRDIKLLTKRPKNGYIERLRLFADTVVLMVKLCDRLHNLRTLATCSRKKQCKQITETREVYLPLADLLIFKLRSMDRWRGEYLKARMVELCDYYVSILKKRKRRGTCE